MSAKYPLPKSRLLPVPEVEIFEIKPRWRNAPKICIAVNLLAHDSQKDVFGFLKNIAMDSHLKRVWLCEQCGKYHHECYSGYDVK
jgi:hypothetical protein